MMTLDADSVGSYNQDQSRYQLVEEGAHMKRPNATSAMVLAALVCFVSSPAIAQTITGVVSGTVVDTSGLAIAGTAVTLVDTATGLRQSASTEASGDFV